MDALEVLHNRVSSTRMRDETPSDEVLDNVYRAALRAADHALLRPWRFLVLKGEARRRLGELFADAVEKSDPATPEAVLNSTRDKALRAPVIVVAICSPREHPKVPVLEQTLSTGAAIQNMLNAAHAQALGAIWRTGPMTEDIGVRRGLGVEGKETIVGFLYLGYTSGPARSVPCLKIADFFHQWPTPQ